MARTAKPTGRPVIPRAIEPDPEHVVIRRGGDMEATDSAIIVLEEYDADRMRAGYICLQCMEDLDTAFPDECPICRYPMATRQAERFAKEFQGNMRVGPSTTLDEEREIMQELRRRGQQEIKTPQIIVPRMW